MIITELAGEFFETTLKPWARKKFGVREEKPQSRLLQDRQIEAVHQVHTYAFLDFRDLSRLGGVCRATDLAVTRFSFRFRAVQIQYLPSWYAGPADLNFLMLGLGVYERLDPTAPMRSRFHKIQERLKFLGAPLLALCLAGGVTNDSVEQERALLGLIQLAVHAGISPQAICDVLAQALKEMSGKIMRPLTDKEKARAESFTREIQRSSGLTIEELS